MPSATNKRGVNTKTYQSMVRSTCKILGRVCSCPFSQSSIDLYTPTERSYWVYFRPMASEFYDNRLQDFACLINSLKNLYLVNKYMHPKENEWLVDFCGFNSLALVMELAEHLRCTLKVVNIYEQKLILERTPQSDEIMRSYRVEVDYCF